MKKYGVFVSYSREDVAFVNPIVELIGAMRKDLVFQDIKSLQKGKPWMPQLLEALKEADVVLVFWCKHSAGSEYVKLEYETAVKNNKEVIPLQLDDSELIKPLADYEGIDFRGMHIHDRLQVDAIPRAPVIEEDRSLPPLPPQMPAPLPPPSSVLVPKRRTFTSFKNDLLGILSVAAVIFIALYFLQSGSSAMNNTTSSGGPSGPGGGFPWKVVWMALSLLILFFAIWRFIAARRRKLLNRKREQHKQDTEALNPQGTVLGQMDKAILEADISPIRNREIIRDVAKDVLKKLNEKLPTERNIDAINQQG